MRVTDGPCRDGQKGAAALGVPEKGVGEEA